MTNDMWHKSSVNTANITHNVCWNMGDDSLWQPLKNVQAESCLLEHGWKRIIQYSRYSSISLFLALYYYPANVQHGSKMTCIHFLCYILYYSKYPVKILFLFSTHLNFYFPFLLYEEAQFLYFYIKFTHMGQAQPTCRKYLMTVLKDNYIIFDSV